MMGLKMTKSALAFAQEALQLAERCLPAYSCAVSRHDFTQAQLFALLALREFLHLDYRALTVRVAEWAELRAALKLKKVPHYTCLQKAQARFLKKKISINF